MPLFTSFAVETVQSNHTKPILPITPETTSAAPIPNPNENSKPV